MEALQLNEGVSVADVKAAFWGVVIPTIIMFALQSVMAGLATIMFAYIATRIKYGRVQARIVLIYGSIIPVFATGFLILGGTAKIASMLVH